MAHWWAGGGGAGGGGEVEGAIVYIKKRTFLTRKADQQLWLLCHADTFTTKSSTVRLFFSENTEGKQGKDGITVKNQHFSWRQIHFLTIWLVLFQWRCFPWGTSKLWPWYFSSAVCTWRLNHWGKHRSWSPMNSLMIVSVLDFTVVVVVVSAEKEPSVRFSSCITFGNTNKLENDRTGFRRSWRTLLLSAPNLSTCIQEISKVFSPTMSWGQTCRKPECK